MSTLFVTMTNLKNELMKKYGNNRIFLKEVMNTDDVMVICFNVGGNYDSVVGEVVSTSEGWMLGEFYYELFEMLVNDQKSLKEMGVLN
jgi:hypothetical protein